MLRQNVVFLLLRPQVLFFLLALVILGPLLQPGLLLTLDSLLAFNFDTSGYFWGTSDGAASVFAPTYNSALVAAGFKLFNLVLPYWVIEKGWLVLLFWLCGMGAFQLPYLRSPGNYYAGLFYTANPFTYIRFVSGQWGILGAYALMPFAVTAFIRLLEDPQPRHVIRLVLILTAIGFLQVHGLLLAGLILVILFLSRALVVKGSLKNSLPALLLGLAAFIGINAFWMVRYVISGGGAVHNMPAGELEYFAASSLLDVLSLRGFWLSDAYVDIADLLPIWWVLLLPWSALVLYGVLSMAKFPHLRWVFLSLLITALVSIVLALGPVTPLVQTAFQWLWEYVPWYRAFRDSHKLVGLLALVYAYFGAFGLTALWRAAPDRWSPTTWMPHIAAGLVVVTAVIYALPIFGTAGQLRPTDFPPDWYVVRSILEDDREDYHILVLPWHLYMDFPWLENRWQRLANPAPRFFTPPVISGDNLESNVSFSNSSNPQSQYVERLLRQRESLQRFGHLIAPLNAKYVVLYKASDYQSYGFLREQEDLEVLFDSGTITLFRNLAPTSQLYFADHVAYIDNLDRHLDQISHDRPLSTVYAVGAGKPQLSGNTASAGRPVARTNAVKINPVSYRVARLDGQYLVLVPGQHDDYIGWKYGGEGAVLTNLGMLPVFAVSPDEHTLSFTRFFTLYLPTYALAAVSLIILALMYLRWRDAG
jgi:hypothetical protein